MIPNGCFEYKALSAASLLNYFSRYTSGNLGKAHIMVATRGYFCDCYVLGVQTII